MLAALSAALVANELASAQGAGVSCLGVPATIQGTQGDDNVVGTEGDDSIYTFGGNDVVNGLGGNDRICVSDGVNVAQGGQGDDVIEGGPTDDFLAGDLINGPREYGSGDDEVRGGLGADVVVGDSISGDAAAGQGDDQVNGGPGEFNDIVVGDAFANNLAIGSGDDTLEAGPGTDIIVGDAMLGTPASAGTRALARQSDQILGAFGFGGDHARAQTEDDLVVGDALNFNRPSGQRGDPASQAFNDAAQSVCSRQLAFDIERLRLQGWDESEIADFVEDTLKEEFGKGWLVGDCLSFFGHAIGAERDTLNGGTESDLTVGDNVAGGVASGNQPGVESQLGGKGNDAMVGDHLNVTNEEIADAAERSFGVEVLSAQYFIDVTTMPRPIGPPLTADSLFDNTFRIEVFANGTPDRDSGTKRGAATVEGGGKDEVRGGQGEDYMEGGARRDKCSGGPGEDDFARKGPGKCEETTGDP